LFESTKRSLGFKKVLGEVLRQSDELGSQFASTKALQQAITKDAKLFQKVQEEITKIGDKSFDKLEDGLKERKELIKSLSDEKEADKWFLKNQEKMDDLRKDATNDLQDHLNNLIAQEKSTKKIKNNFTNIKDAVDELGEKIRNPSIAVEGMLTNLGKFPMYLQKAQKEGKGFGTIIKDIGKSMLGGLKNAASLLFTPTGLLILGVGAAVAAMTGLFKLFTNYWDFLDKKVIPAQAEFTREIGGSSKETKGLATQMQSAGVEMEMLGYSFEEGTAMIRDFAKAANTGLTIPKDVLKTGKELTFVLGMTAEQSGKLVQQFQKQGLGMSELNDMFKVGAREAKAYGLPVNEVLRDIGDAPDILARFGLANRKEFAVSAAKARSYGLTIKELDAAFGKQLDTFEGSSIAAAKLNTIFGTNINSMKLMMEHDPVKRMEMLRKSLIGQGKDWEHLSVAERNVITQTLGVDEATAQLTLSSDKERKKLEAKNLERKRQIKVDEDWNRGMGSIKKTLIAWGPLLDKLMRTASNFIVKLFGGDSAADTVTNTAKSAENAINVITKAISDATGQIELYKELFDSIWSPIDSHRAENVIELINKQNKSMEEQLDIAKSLSDEKIKGIVENKLKISGRTAEQAKDLTRVNSTDLSGINDSLQKFSKTVSTATIGSKEIQESRNVMLEQQKKAYDIIVAQQDLQQQIIEQRSLESKLTFPDLVQPKIDTSAQKAKRESSKKMKEDREKEDKKKSKENTDMLAKAIARELNMQPMAITVNMDGTKVGDKIVRRGVGSK
jgi:hypothetical protein